MKKLFNAFLALAAGLAIAGCAKEYDDSALQDKVNNLDKKVTELEKKVNSLTEEVTGLATTVKQWKEGGFVESVTEIKEGDVVVGYTVKFVGGQTVVLTTARTARTVNPARTENPEHPVHPASPEPPVPQVKMAQRPPSSSTRATLYGLSAQSLSL